MPTLLPRTTLRGLELLMRWGFRQETPPANLTIQLFDSSVIPSPTTVDTTGLTEISQTNGYAPVTLELSNVGFPTITRNDGQLRVELGVKAHLWTVSVDTIPPAPGLYRVWAITTPTNDLLGYIDLDSTEGAGSGGFRTSSQVSFPDVVLQLEGVAVP